MSKFKYGVPSDGYKYCSVCGLKLPNESFSKDGKGLSCRCKKCQSERYKKYRKEHREEIKARAKITSSERHKRYYETHKEKYKEELKIRRKNNPDLFASYRQKRLAKQRDLPSTLSVEEWEKCKGYFDNKCAYCGKGRELTQDHFIPLSKGGEYTINNIIPACKSCNPSKSDKDFFEWYPKSKHYSKKREHKILKYLGYKERTQQLAIF